MIKNYKISQTSLSSVSPKMIDANVNGFIVTDKRIYYQGKGAGTKPEIVGNSNYWIPLSTGTSNTQKLQIGKKYVRTAGDSNFNLPGDEFAQTVGDTIEFYNKHKSNFNIYNQNTSFISTTDNTSGQYYKFFWDGTKWQVMDGGGTGAEQKADKIITSLNKHWNYDGLTTIANPIYISALPSATLVKNSDNATTKTAAMGIVNVVSAAYNTTTNRVPSTNLTGTASIDGTTLTKYVGGEIHHNLSSYLRSSTAYGTYGTIYLSALPSANIDTFGITKIIGSYTSATISGGANSKYPMAASAVYRLLSGMDISSKVSGRLTGVQINGVKYTEDNGNSVANLGDNFAKVTGAVAGQYVIRTETGYTTSQGIATLSATRTLDSGVYSIDAGNEAIPVTIQTPAGNLYPILKGSLTVGTSNHYMINIKPYLAYDNTTTTTGTWKIFYGAGISDMYTKANTVVPGTAGGSSYNILYGSGDVHVITVNGTGTLVLTVPAYNASTATQGLPIGHGMIIKIINTTGRAIAFGSASNIIISSAGTYSFSVFNFSGTVERVGEVTVVYS